MNNKNNYYEEFEKLLNNCIYNIIQFLRTREMLNKYKSIEIKINEEYSIVNIYGFDEYETE